MPPVTVADPSLLDSLGCPLSARELQIIDRVAQGDSNLGIGNKLGLSPLTVKSHLARIGDRLGTGDRAHMVAICMRAGWVE